MYKIFETDYLPLGATGFAQVVDPEYYVKQQIEAGVLLEHIQRVHPIPEEFERMCSLKWASHSHDFGQYHDLELRYLTYQIEAWENNDEDKFERFWAYANMLECFDFENQELLDKMEDLYKTQKSIEKLSKKEFSYGKV